MRAACAEGMMTVTVGRAGQQQARSASVGGAAMPVSSSSSLARSASLWQVNQAIFGHSVWAGKLVAVVSGILALNGWTLVVRCEVALARRPGRTPVTTSFPSGHAAAAAAFATGVGLEMPALAVPVGMLAAAVGLARIVNGAHFPSDIAGGWVVGVSVGMLTLRWWPLRTGPAD